MADGLGMTMRDVGEPGASVPGKSLRGCSSAGRAPALQAGGQRFDPAQLHHWFGGIGSGGIDLAAGIGYCFGLFL